MKKVFFSVLFLFVTMSQSVYPMGAAFNTFSTILSHTLFFGPFGLMVGVDQIGKWMDKNGYNLYFSRVDGVTDKFVRKVLSDAGYPLHMIESLQIKSVSPLSYGDHGYAAKHNTILVPKQLEVALKKERIDEKEIDESKLFNEIEKKYGLSKEDVEIVLGSQAHIVNCYTIPCAKVGLAHEGGHILHNHDLKLSFALFGIPSAIQFLTSCSARVFNKIIKKPSSNYIRGFAKLGGLPFKLFAGATAYSLFFCTLETQADTEAIKRIKNPKSLRTQAKLLESVDRFHQVNFKERFGINSKEYSNIASFCEDTFHPHPSTRSERFRKAAEELEKKNKQK